MEEGLVTEGGHPKQLHLILENIKEQLSRGKFSEKQKR
jgi:hypothetical protein